MRFSIAKNVSLLGVQPQMQFYLVVALQVFAEQGSKHVVLTAVTNGEHMRGSRHKFGLALDLDPIDFNPAQIKRAADEIRARVPDEFDIVAHDSHVHGEWDIK